MRRLLLLRHAKAVPLSSGDDYQRALSSRGRDEARRRPDLARQVMRQARERGGRMVAHLLMEGVGAPYLADEAQARVAARFFAEAVLLPFLLRALAEEDLGELRAEIAEHAKARATFFLAALKNGGLGAA